jgi:hypothetical protein
MRVCPRVYFLVSPKMQRAPSALFFTQSFFAAFTFSSAWCSWYHPQHAASQQQHRRARRSYRAIVCTRQSVGVRRRSCAAVRRHSF